jgi:hypothetical protein
VGSGKKTVLYDPAGSFMSSEKPPVRGSGDTMVGSNADLDKYIEYQCQDGPKVSVFRFNTTPEDEELLKQNIDEVGGCGPGLCSACTGNAIRGEGPFKDLGSTINPWWGMQREMERISGGTGELGCKKTSDNPEMPALILPILIM